MQGLLVVILALCALCASSFEIRIAHASPDAAAVDVLVNGQVAERFTNLAFRAVSHYIFLRPGNYLFQVVPHGQKTPVILSYNTTINDPLSPFTLAITGPSASVKSIVYSDDKVPPRRGYSALRFVHVSADAPAVDIRIDGQTKPIFTNVAYGQATAYQELPRGDVKVQLLQTGTSTVLLEVPARLIPDVPTSVWAEGLVADKSLLGVISRDL